MTDLRYFWLGSQGPFICDADEDVNDPDLLYDGFSAPAQAPLVTTGVIKAAGVSDAGWGAVYKTISSAGYITVTPEQHHVKLTGYGDLADTLIGITGGEEGQLLVLRGKTGLSYNIIVSQSGGSLKLTADFTIDSTYDAITLLGVGSDEWIELSQANNS